MFEGIRSTYRLARAFSRGGARSNRTLAAIFERHARSSRAEHPFLLYGDQRFSYREANALINRHVGVYKTLGIGRGDVVALLMDNRPEFLWHFLAAGKLGAIASLINTHNSGAPLAHSLRICSPSLIVVGSEHAEAFEAVRPELGLTAKLLLDIDPEQPAGAPLPELPLLGPLLQQASEEDPPETGQHELKDMAAYIYTSGTTGLPKAALVRHQRLYFLAHSFAAMVWRLRDDDVLYNCLPLYHTNGLGGCTSAVITRGATLALARRFSASAFWDDLRRHQATGFIYIGELCRYLAVRPEQPGDREHRVRVMVGNGLRGDIWSVFKERFGIERIIEFYGSTEGNAASVNFNGPAGSVGRLYPGSVLARWDDEAEDFMHGPDGFLVKCKRGEPGVLLGRIRGNNGFDGYRDRSETERKVIRGAFRKGDAWFNTGDLLRTDAKGNLFFVDRMGDTFRWKGENVSTFEVQEQIAGFPDAVEVNVYGVRVPGTEGRAGMVALVLRNGFDPQAFKRHVDARLAAYARPLLVRVQDKLEVTSTFKLKKAGLRDEGFDPSVSPDPLYLRHPERDAYVPLTPDLFEELRAGRLRL